ncbi:WASH complex subunit 2 isoform X2 [Selaginella moellendorffii]|uniref:WASH complex subunit 2 isoform X2 n=1 Tax=Selaginella moellendorffii TaxID=88036 RepID=UPI000D1CEA26|nr:WASH complex subunit 2 isoform X2 [Selaginella moellendorffii]|eukprot:XP_024540574.1 WASH complex subunit 2 isoform X2 [Selaginella moellendorffii]
MEEREKLRALLEHSATSGFSLQSGAQLQEWLERFAASVKGRAEDLRAQIDRLADHTASVEQDLKNAFNSFRLLSNTQFIENRVYEEDETVTPEQEKDGEPQRVESYEGDIVPRYKEAVTTAWNEHLKLSRSREARPRSLPYIIGSEEFMRDPHCGLPDLRHKASTSVTREYDSEAEKDGVNMAAEMVAGGVISDDEWSEPSNEAPEDQDHHEPAVSAAMDFKAMLEAALRASYVTSDDGSRMDPIYEPANLNAENETGLGSASNNDIVNEAKATLDDILGKIAREADQRHYSPQQLEEERARREAKPQILPPPVQPDASSSDKSSHWSESEEDASSHHEPRVSFSFPAGTQPEFPDVGQEESRSQAAEKAGSSSDEALVSKDTSEPSTSSARHKSLFDEDEDEDDEGGEEEEKLSKLNPVSPQPSLIATSTRSNETPEPLNPIVTPSRSNEMPEPLNPIVTPSRSNESPIVTPSRSNETPGALTPIVTPSRSNETLGALSPSPTTLNKPPAALPFRSTALSSLLFGDEDNDDDEDALFGPVASTPFVKPSNDL